MEREGSAPRVAGALLLASVACLPLMCPPGPAGSRPADLAVLLLFLAVTPYLGRITVAAPPGIVLGAFLIVLGGCLGALDVADPVEFLLTLVRDAYPFVLFLVACRLLRDAELHRRCLTLLAWTAVGAAVVAIVVYELRLAGRFPLFGPGQHIGRAVGTFQNPNMAAGFFLLGVFLLPVVQWPRARWVRAVAGLVVLWAIWLTGSNAAKMALVTGATTYVLFGWVRTGQAALRPVKLVAVLGSLAAVSVWAVLALSQGMLSLSASRLGHLSLSVVDRALLVRENLGIWQRHPMGVGAGMTASARSVYTLHKQESGGHNEFLTMLVERGVIGEIGFLVLIGAVLRRAGRSSGSVGHPCPTCASHGAAYAAAFVALLTVGMTHDIIHFRYLWVLMALIAAAKPASGLGTGRSG